ncbi:MAG: transcriptional regulator [Verrucomicrobiales bacterium]|nr:transcriptional regulator [Verrucomicrobiales bacterium]
MDPEWQTYYDRLVELRDYLLHSRQVLKSDADNATPRFSMHMADAATDSYDRDFALSMLSSEQDAIYEIEQALERIRDEKYGICEMTGKPISRERLNAIPWTRFAADAENDLERRGDVATTKLGELERVKKESTAKASEETE